MKLENRSLLFLSRSDQVPTIAESEKEAINNSLLYISLRYG